MLTPVVHARLRNVPTRAVAALLLFGGLLGAPALLGLVGALFVALELPVLGVVSLLLSFAVFTISVVLAWVFIFQGRTRLKRAEQALYAGDFETATREARTVIATVFRSDYQMGALFTLALTAERIGAFPEAAALFQRAFAMIPAMAAQRPGRRARALMSAHATLALAAANALPEANAMLARCHAQLGPAGQPGAFEALLDDSGMGAIGINTMLVELENRRDPRPLAVLASMLVAFKNGHVGDAAQVAAREQASLAHGLAPHERALATRLQREAMRLTSGAGPHRSPSALAPTAEADGAEWADRVLGLRAA